MLVRLLSRLREERFPVRFIVSRFLWRTGLLPKVKLTTRFRGGLYHASESSLGVGLWVDAGKYENEVLREIERWLRPGDTFVDVGANVGLFSVLAAGIVGESGTVVAVEPHPRVHRFLTENLALNSLQRVKTHQVAVGAEAGTAFLSDRHADDQNALAATGTLAVSVVRLDSLLGDVPHIRVLKIDVEGHELEVLRGAGDVLQRCDAVLLELWSDAVPPELAAFEIRTIHHAVGVRDVIAIRKNALPPAASDA
jgi:FkbM family methyltransferase